MTVRTVLRPPFASCGSLQAFRLGQRNRKALVPASGSRALRWLVTGCLIQLSGRIHRGTPSSGEHRSPWSTSGHRGPCRQEHTRGGKELGRSGCRSACKPALHRQAARGLRKWAEQGSRRSAVCSKSGHTDSHRPGGSEVHSKWGHKSAGSSHQSGIQLHRHEPSGHQLKPTKFPERALHQQRPERGEQTSS